MSADMSPYCSAHDEWLVMKLCMYVEYHDANNVSNFGGDPIKFTKPFYSIIHTLFTDMALHSRDTVTVSAAVATRSHADCSSMEGHTSLSTALVKNDFTCSISVIVILYLVLKL